MPLANVHLLLLHPYHYEIVTSDVGWSLEEGRGGVPCLLRAEQHPPDALPQPRAPRPRGAVVAEPLRPAATAAEPCAHRRSKT